MPDLPNRTTVLVFDWGNTLMKVFPSFSGPMADWPEVAEVEGAASALTALKDQYSLVIATNAVDSTPEQVWQALRRVSLAGYFKAVFTSSELGAKKPESHFFRQIASVLDETADHLVMIGDDYAVDILGAKAAGWKAVWYNPNHQIAPGLLPFQDAEIAALIRLPQALQQLRLPDYTTCLNWLLARSTPYNILDHVQLVAAVAYQLAAWLAQKGVSVDPVITQRGAMLHDLAKIDSIQRNQERGDSGDHARLAHDLLIQRGQPILAEIADRHMPYQDPVDPRRPLTWEQKLVHFADKLSEGAQLVTIADRIQALKARYPQFSEALGGSWPNLLLLQEEICGLLRMTPEELNQQLQKALGLLR